MIVLNYDILFNIIDLNENIFSKFYLINKEFNERYKKDRYRKNVYKILKWYKLNTYSLGDNWELPVKKIDLIKYYRKYYPYKYLKFYPEFIADKLNRSDLKDYIKNKMTKKRTKLDVILFLNNNNINISEIETVGW